MKRLQLLIATLTLSIAVSSCSSLMQVVTTALTTVSTVNGSLTTRVVACSRSGNSVTIDMEMLNRGIDETITINNSYIKLYDNVGNIYTKENSTIRVSAGGGTRGPFTTTNYPQGVPLRYTIDVAAIDRRATGFRVIEIGASSSGRNNLKPSAPITLRSLYWSEL